MITAQTVSSTSIMVNWMEVPLINQNGVIITYEVLYEPIETFGGQLEGRSLNVTSQFSALLTDLEEFVAYNISVRAFTIEGAGPYSANVIKMTHQDSTYYSIPPWY